MSFWKRNKVETQTAVPASDEERAPAEATPASEAPASSPENSAPVADVAIGDEAQDESVRPAKQGLVQRVRAWRAESSVMPDALPIRILMGHLPEVTERDAREYAQGIAEKHFEQMGLSFFDAYEFGNGYVFEAHEGGPGRAYAPDIIRHFNGLGPYQVGEINSVVIRTATRLVEVQRTREGLAAILLPEAADIEATPWLRPSNKMTPGLNRRTHFFKAGLALFVSGGVAALLSGTVFRLQPYEAPPEQKVEMISANNLPRSQWARMEALPSNTYVRALRYRNDKWEAPELATDIPTAPAPAAGQPGKTP